MVSPVKICLLGQRSNISPLSYREYRKLFEKRLCYVDKAEQADIVVYSCWMDIRDDVQQLQELFSARPDIRLVILSEEPLWDTLWGGDFLSRQAIVDAGNRTHPCTVLNHFTSGIFDFEKIPYFLTTNDDYFARYAFFFKRNSACSRAELRDLWGNALLKSAFYAEYRDDDQYEAEVPAHDVFGLCRYRTLIAMGLEGEGIVREGHGWGTTIRRTSLPDWHLDKLASLDRRAFIVSGIENTHQWNYLSEKLFDAFAVLAVPLYVAGPLHSATRLVDPDAFLNLYDLSAEHSLRKISRFQPDDDFIDRYLDVQKRLAGMFAQPQALVEERKRVVAAVVSELEGCCLS